MFPFAMMVGASALNPAILTFGWSAIIILGIIVFAAIFCAVIQGHKPHAAL